MSEIEFVRVGCMIDRLEEALDQQVAASASGDADVFVHARATFEQGAALVESVLGRMAVDARTQTLVRAGGSSMADLTSIPAGRASPPIRGGIEFVKWDPKLHPRDRIGRWRDVLAKLRGKPGGQARLVTIPERYREAELNARMLGVSAPEVQPAPPLMGENFPRSTRRESPSASERKAEAATAANILGVPLPGSISPPEPLPERWEKPSGSARLANWYGLTPEQKRMSDEEKLAAIQRVEPGWTQYGGDQEAFDRSIAATFAEMVEDGRIPGGVPYPKRLANRSASRRKVKDWQLGWGG